MLYKEGDVLVVACRNTGSVCVLLGACVDVSVCVFRSGIAMSVWYAGRVLGYGVLIAGCITAAF